MAGRERAKLNGVLRPLAHLSRIHLAYPSDGFVATPKAVALSFGWIERMQLLQKIQDYVNARIKSHGLAVATSSYLEMQECLKIEEMWRDKARKRWLCDRG